MRGDVKNGNKKLAFYLRCEIKVNSGHAKASDDSRSTIGFKMARDRFSPANDQIRIKYLAAHNAMRAQQFPGIFKYRITLSLITLNC
jgi:hypothetical protein